MSTEAYVRAAVLAQLEWEAKRNRPGSLTETESRDLVIRANYLIASLKASVLRDVLEDLDDAGLDAYAANEFGTWVAARANNIERDKP